MRDDVVHLSGDARPLGGCGEKRLLISLDFESVRPLGQPAHLGPQLPHDDPGQKGCRGHARQEDQRL